MNAETLPETPRPASPARRAPRPHGGPRRAPTPVREAARSSRPAMSLEPSGSSTSSPIMSSHLLASATISLELPPLAPSDADAGALQVEAQRQARALEVAASVVHAVAAVMRRNPSFSEPPYIEGASSSSAGSGVVLAARLIDAGSCGVWRFTVAEAELIEDVRAGLQQVAEHPGQLHQHQGGAHRQDFEISVVLAADIVRFQAPIEGAYPMSLAIAAPVPAWVPVLDLDGRYALGHRLRADVTLAFIPGVVPESQVIAFLRQVKLGVETTAASPVVNAHGAHVGRP